MNLTKALKHKKKLVKQIDEMFIRFSKFNSVEKGSVGYDPEQTYNQWVELTNKLVDLKTKIHIANAGIANKIFTLGELKNMAAKIRNVSTQEGTVKDRYSDVIIEYTVHMNLFVKDARVKEYRHSDAAPVQYVAYMDLFAKDNQIATWEQEIETLQEEIEAFNAITKI